MKFGAESVPDKEEVDETVKFLNGAGFIAYSDGAWVFVDIPIPEEEKGAKNV